MKMLRKLLLTAILAVIALAGHTLYARQISIVGMVVDEQGNPLSPVDIIDVTTQYRLGTTNLDGKFSIEADEETILRFSYMTMEREVPVNGQTVIEISLEKPKVLLNEIEVGGEYIPKPKLKPEPTDITYRNGHLHISTRITVPNKYFRTASRATVQPVMLNLSKGVKQYMPPMVIEGWRYDITQDRMLDFDKEHADPCAPYIKKEFVKQDEHNGKAFSVAYIDSIKCDNPNDQYACQMFTVIENYNKVYSIDTMTIAQGTINPLRFFEYSMLGRMIEDPKYLPSPEKSQHTDDGNVDLSFEVNSTTLNLDYGRNREVLDSLIDVLHRYENDPSFMIKSFSLTAKSSPEGVYARNIALSKARMHAALDLIMSKLSKSTIKYMEKAPETFAEVESWQVLVDRLHSDGHHEEAEKVQEIIDTYGESPDMCSSRIRRLPFYRPMITENYLPGMRSVRYRITVKQNRVLTDEEILEKFANDSTSLSEYEYFRMYRDICTEDVQKERIMRLGLKYKPKSRVIANDLAAFLINNKKADPSILDNVFATASPYEKLPNELRYNQVAALLAVGRYLDAYDMAHRLPEDDSLYRKARNYAKIFNREFPDDVVEEESRESLMNDVLLSLCLNKNEVALAKSRGLGDSAEEEYVKAICCRRIAKNDENLWELADEAETHLYNALAKKPELMSVLLTDGDLIDFYQELERNKKLYPDEEKENTDESESGGTTTESGSETEDTENTESNTKSAE